MYFNTYKNNTQNPELTPNSSGHSGFYQGKNTEEKFDKLLQIHQLHPQKVQMNRQPQSIFHLFFSASFIDVKEYFK